MSSSEGTARAPHDGTPGAYDGKTDDQLMNLARRAFFDAFVARPFTIERAMAWARYDAVAAELKRRAALRINAELGLPDVDL